MSSDILSKPVDISQFGLIYAGAQKNMGPAGVTLVIIRKDLLDSNFRDVPTMMRYKTHSSKDSMFNTPPVFSVFVINEMLKWIDGIGGLTEMEKLNKKKAKVESPKKELAKERRLRSVEKDTRHFKDGPRAQACETPSRT